MQALVRLQADLDMLVQLEGQEAQCEVCLNMTNALLGTLAKRVNQYSQFSNQKDEKVKTAAAVGEKEARQ